MYASNVFRVERRRSVLDGPLSEVVLTRLFKLSSVVDGGDAAKSTDGEPTMNVTVWPVSRELLAKLS